ncbi:MAG: carboxypeptidase regulatory-like domain-containing protein [Bacteroidota bacterium]
MNVNNFLRALSIRVKYYSTAPVKLLFIGAALLLFAFTPRDTDPLVRIVTILQKWTDSIPQEKVYLQMDKPYYALGDTIWFKGYVTIGSRHQLSALSGSLYVDLITDQDSVIRSLKLPITAGMVMGNFTLNDDFNEGSYRIRSYTRWMRNAGEEYFFDKTITVGSVFNDNIVTKATYQYKNVNNKPVLTALLNYTSEDGKALGSRNVRYEIYVNKKRQWIQNLKTDALGNVLINIDNDKNINLAGAYIRTTITGSDKQEIIRDFPIKASLVQSDVQFFPESGNLVNGIMSRVAFKAVGIDGAGIAIKGKVTDNENNEVATIQTLHAGMGSFTLRPSADKTYTANISFEDGTTKTIALPKAADEGYVLSIYQPNKDSILVRVNVSPAKQQSTINLLAHTNGETIFASPVKIEKAITSIWLDKKLFPSGIAQFTIFDNNAEPLNERIAFIRSNDLMTLNLKTAKTEYNSKEHVQVELEANDSKGKLVPGNFSVSVIDESKVPMDETRESTIFSNILLTSDLKGYVEKPNYYFVKETVEVNRALDNLMLTQGYRRFTWKELNNIANTKPVFGVEGLGFEVSGTVKTLGNKILPGANVTLISVIAGVTKATTTDANGRFKFDGIFLTDSIKFSLGARTAKGSDKVKIIVDTIPKIGLGKNKNLAEVSTNIYATLKAYIDNGKKLDDIYEKTGQLDKVQRLKEVRIKAKRLKAPSNITPQGMFKIPEQSADRVITFDESEAANCATLAMCLQARLPGVSVEPSGQYGLMALIDMRTRTPMTLILDGRKITNADEVDEILQGSIQPENVAKILLVRTNRAIISSLGGGENSTFVLIMTKLGSFRKQYNPSVANISPKGFNKVREFYSPRYDRPGDAMKLPDLRTTVYWNPYLKTDADGKAVFNFFNADGPGTYKVIVEGINAAGELGRQVYRYTVTGEPGNPGATFAIPNAEKDMGMITAPLDSFNKRLPVEKVYLHTDKPHYNIGDTLWFKSYLLDGVNLTASKLSGLLYVELDDDSTQMVRRISIPIKDGLGWGQIPLVKNIFHEGGYTLRAYTNWMQNLGEERFFSQRFYLGVPAQEAWLVKSAATINRVEDKDRLDVSLFLNRSDKLTSPVGLRKVEVKIYDQNHYLYSKELQTGLDGSLKLSSVLKEKADGKRLRVQIRSLEPRDGDKTIQVPLNINRNQNIDVQFLPESGNLVAGLKSTVGFKAIGEDGKGTPVLGGLYNSKGAEVASLTTLHNGMGSFEFTPVNGEIYMAKLTRPTAKNFVLPKIRSIGTVMHVSNPENADDLRVSIYASAGISTTDTACYLIGTSRGVMYYSQKVDFNQKDITVSKKLFPSGIAKFTLFKGKRPLNERIAFIDNKEQLNIKFSQDKPTYHKRDSVGLEIAVVDKTGIPVKGNFSLAVTDDSQVKPDSAGNYGMASSLLINSDLKGYVESPGYYINRTDKQAWQALDNLMLTQGWTGYSWKDVFTHKPAKFLMEKEFKITGRVSNLTNKPIPNAEVIISSRKPSFLTKTTTDSAGIYVFKNLPNIDSGSFFLQANGAKGKKLTFGDISVVKFRAPAVPTTLRDQLQPWYVNSDTTQINYVRRKAEISKEDNIKMNGIVLKEVKIKSKKVIQRSTNPLGEGVADLVYDEKDIKESAVQNLYELLKQKVPGFNVARDFSTDQRRIAFDGDYAVPKINRYYADVTIDGRPLPLYIDNKYSVEEYIDEVSQIQIVNLTGLEVIWTNPLLGRLRAVRHPPIPHIIITTKDGNGWFKSNIAGVAKYRPLPLMKPEQFYSPKYKVETETVIVPDYRATLHWEPNISTDINGKAKVSFYTSDITGKYTVTITGVDEAGGIGDGTLKLKSN